MSNLTSRERVMHMLKRQPHDRIPVCESFWSDTHSTYAAQGHLKQDEDLAYHLNLDIVGSWTFNCTADLDFTDQVVEETDETRLVKNGNGATYRWWKNKSGTPENVDFTVKDRASWEAYREKLLNPDERRINFEGYRQAKARAKAEDKFFVWEGINVFEQMHPLCGHEICW